MTTNFVGWIPNVAGRLSFSHIGQTRHPAPCLTLNEDDGSVRIVICAQKRVLSDTLVRPGYFRFVYGYDPTWHFVFVAKSQPIDLDKRAKLVGEVFVFNAKRWNSGHQGGVPAKTTVGEAVSDGNVAFEDELTRAAFVGEALGKLKDELRELSVYTVRCEIDRNGIAKLDAIQATALLFATAVTQKAAKIDEYSKRYLVNQAYFFLKDVSHNHRHHHKRADTITSAHLDDADDSWIRETQYSIHRRVVEKRRSSAPSVLYEALGLMAYMSAFKHVAASQPQNTSGKESAESYSLKETEDSIKASLEAKRWKRVQMNLIITAIPTLVLALTALLKPSEGDRDVETIFEFLRSLLQGMFPMSFSGLASVFLIAAGIPFVYGTWNPMEIFYSIKRIAIVWPTNRRVVAFVMSSAACLLVAVFSAYMFKIGAYSANNVWLCAMVAIFVTMLLIWAIPYIFTVPDLFKLMRTYPVRPDLSVHAPVDE